MKIRIGFVSNSSSSSFIIIGSPLKNREIENCAEELINNGRLYALAGDGWGEGEDFFPISKEMWETYKKYGAKAAICFYNVQHMINEDGTIKKNEIDGDEFNIFYMNVTYHICETLKEFQERYIAVPQDPVPDNIVKKAQQARKLQEEIRKNGYNINDISE